VYDIVFKGGDGQSSDFRNWINNVDSGEGLMRCGDNTFTERVAMPQDLALRPLKNTPFRPISVSGSNFNPRNTHCIPVVKIFAFLELKRN
jgi:hypothetical protein